MTAEGTDRGEVLIRMSVEEARAAYRWDADLEGWEGLRLAADEAERAERAAEAASRA